MNNSLIVDNLTVEIRRSGRRRHVDLTVERDGSVVVAVPESLSD